MSTPAAWFIDILFDDPAVAQIVEENNVVWPRDFYDAFPLPVDACSGSNITTQHGDIETLFAENKCHSPDIIKRAAEPPERAGDQQSAPCCSYFQYLPGASGRNRNAELPADETFDTS